MVDPDVLRRRTDQVLHHVRRLRGREDLSVELLERDEDIMNAVLMDLQQAIQGCIDLAVHACVDDGLGAPEGPAAAFALLARAGRIPGDLSVRLAGATGLRNLIVHRYGDLDASAIVRIASQDADDLEAFVASFHAP